MSQVFRPVMPLGLWFCCSKLVVSPSEGQLLCARIRANIIQKGQRSEEKPWRK